MDLTHQTYFSNLEQGIRKKLPAQVKFTFASLGGLGSPPSTGKRRGRCLLVCKVALLK